MPRLSYENIQKQIQKLQEQAKKLEANRDAKKTRAITQVRSLMKRLNISLDDLTQASPKPVKKPTSGKSKAGRPIGVRPSVPPKYRDPNTGDTWTGRGKAPRWLQEKLNQGHDKVEFLIDKPVINPEIEPVDQSAGGAGNGDRTRI